MEGFVALYDEKIVRDSFHGFSLKTKSFASAIGAVSIEIRSFGNLDYFTVLFEKNLLKTNQKNQILQKPNCKKKNNKTNKLYLSFLRARENRM